MKTKEEQIKKLINLAKMYQKYFSGKLQLNNHNTLQDDWKKVNHINVYFSSQYTDCSVSFNEIEVSLFTNKVYIPLDITDSKLEKTFEMAFNFLSDYKRDYTTKYKKEIEDKRQEKIESLKKQLEELQK